MATTLDRLTSILVTHNKLAPEMLTPEATMEELKIDSLSMIELLFNIEDEFKVTLPSEDVKLTRLAEVVAYIDELVATQHGPGSLARQSPTAVAEAPAP